MKYVDGYVLPVPKKNLAAYRRMAAEAGKVWRKYGALEFRECVGDDLKTMKVKSFPNLVKPKRGETVVFSWIVYKSRAHRNRVNDKVMKDPRIARMMKNKEMPFDSKRMAYGGFKVMVDAS
jgi:uncharacterized protein YbaA (DUF1428 family)